MGFRDVSRAAISAVLREGKTCIIVPGGQTEMFFSQSWGHQVYVLKKHKGFIREALQHDAIIVPMFAMGEWEQFDNIYWPALQDRTRRALGIPLPSWPVGVFYLPLPRRPPHGLTVVIGAPIDFKRITPETRSTPVDRHGCSGAREGSVAVQIQKYTQEDVDKCHALYYEKLADIFERHKLKCGYPNHELVLLDSTDSFIEFQQAHENLTSVPKGD